MNIGPTQALVARLESGGFDPRPTGPDSWESRCPAHGGDRRNLAVSRGDDGRVLVHCHAHQCPPSEIMGALGMTEADLFPPRDGRPTRPHANGQARAKGGDRPKRTFPTPEATIEGIARKLGKPSAQWTYHDADGEPVMTVFRFDAPDGKSYRPVHRSPDGWAMGDPPGLLPIYRLSELADSDRVFVTEGEKAADAVRHLGLAATTWPHGAKSVRKADWAPLAGKEIAILPDADEPGESAAKDLVAVLGSLDPRPSVRVVRLTDLWRTSEPIPDGGDAVEWLADGVPERWTDDDRRAELERVADSAPVEDLDARPPAEPRDEPDEWGPIRLGTLPPAEPFPLEVLPGPARDLAEAAARSIACPVDFPALACLAAASGAVGRSASLRIKDGYFASASLYAALVGTPSSGKSPALRAALAPLWKLAQTLREQWREEKKRWEGAKDDAKGDEPELSRIVSTDPTTEALGPILAANPRGLTLAPDEMTKWVMGMDQYKGGKGGDRPFYLSVFNGEPIYIDRAKNMREPITVPHPYLSIVGGMTPDMLSTLPEKGGRDDGFLARLLFAYPERIPRRYSETGIPDGVAEVWGKTVDALWERPMREHEGRLAPRVVRMTREAARSWADWCHAHYAEQEADDFPDHLEGPWGKLETYAPRLALILHLVDLAADPTVPSPDDPPDLPRRIMDDAARLVAYFKAHTRRIHEAMGGKADDGGGNVRALLRWIGRNELAEFSTRDIGRNFDRFRDDDAALADALEWMAERNLIRPRPEPDSESGPRRPGRKPAPSFEVNPALWESPRFRQFRRNAVS